MKKLLIAMLVLSPLSVATAAEQHSMNHGMDSMGQMATMDHSQMDHSKMSHGSMTMDADMAMPGATDVGMPAPGAKPDKIVYVMLGDDMTIKFKKDVKIEYNDVVQFVVMNTGKQEHEFVIGSAKEQKMHRDMMKKMKMHDTDTDTSVMVMPGKAKQMLWHFHGPVKTVELSCNMPGHFEAGMTKTIQL